MPALPKSPTPDEAVFLMHSCRWTWEYMLRRHSGLGWSITLIFGGTSLEPGHTIRTWDTDHNTCVLKLYAKWRCIIRGDEHAEQMHLQQLSGEENQELAAAGGVE